VDSPNPPAPRRLWALVAGNRDFRLLLSAGLISLTGDAIMLVGLTFFVYAITGSTLASGITLLTSLVPQIALGSLAGVFVDRWDRRRTMITTNLLLAAGLAPLLAVHHADQIWIVYLVSVWESTVALLFAPAEAALVPVVVADADLVAANGLNTQNRNIARLVGSAAGGLVATLGGIGLLAIVDAGTFVAAAALLTGMKHRVVREPALPGGASASRNMGREWVDGLRVVAGSPMLRTVLWCLAIIGVGEGVFGTLIAPWVHDVLHRGGGAYGLILSVQAIGGIAGGLATATIGHRFTATALLGWGVMAFGALDFTLFAYPLVRPVVWPAFLLMILVGTPAAVAQAGAMTLLQRHTVDASRGRVISSIFSVMSLGMVIGVGLAATLPRWVGIAPVLAIAQGVGPVLAGLLVLTRSRARDRAVVPA
jgi:Na+/melibiose symporter-like transporter